MCLALKLSPASHLQKELWELPTKWIKVYFSVTVTIHWLKFTDIPSGNTPFKKNYHKWSKTIISDNFWESFWNDKESARWHKIMQSSILSRESSYVNRFHASILRSNKHVIHIVLHVIKSSEFWNHTELRNPGFLSECPNTDILHEVTASATIIACL